MTILEALETCLALLHSGRADEAEPICRAVLQAAPQNADAWHLLGCIEFGRRNYDDAEQHVRRALECDPQCADAMNTLGMLRCEQGRWSDAEHWHRRALAAEPTLKQAHHNLGKVLQEMGRIDEAVASFAQAIEIDPLYATAWSSYLWSLNYLPGATREQILAANQEYARRFAGGDRAQADRETPDAADEP